MENRSCADHVLIIGVIQSQQGQPRSGGLLVRRMDTIEVRGIGDNGHTGVGNGCDNGRLRFPEFGHNIRGHSTIRGELNEIIGKGFAPPLAPAVEQGFGFITVKHPVATIRFSLIPNGSAHRIRDVGVDHPIIQRRRRLFGCIFIREVIHFRHDIGQRVHIVKPFRRGPRLDFGAPQGAPQQTDRNTEFLLQLYRKIVGHCGTVGGCDGRADLPRRRNGFLRGGGINMRRIVNPDQRIISPGFPKVPIHIGLPGAKPHFPHENIGKFIRLTAG